MKPFPGKGRTFFQAPREIEALEGLSSDAKRLWAYGRFREYPAKPAAISETEIARDLAMKRRTVQRAKQELLDHSQNGKKAPLLIVHQRGTRHSEKSRLHFLLPGESTPRCCGLKAVQESTPRYGGLKMAQRVQAAKTRVTTHRVGGLIGTAQAGCDGATPEKTNTCAPHRTEQINELKENAGGAAAGPKGPPPAGDDNRPIETLAIELAFLKQSEPPDGGVIGRRLTAEIERQKAGATSQAAPASPPPVKRPAVAPAPADDPDVLRLAEALLVA